MSISARRVVIATRIAYAFCTYCKPRVIYYIVDLYLTFFGFSRIISDMAKVVFVQKGGSAEKAGLCVADEITAINGRVLVDVLDIEYACAESVIELDVLRDGQSLHISYAKEAYAPLGFDCDESLDLEPIRCHNRCVFCFVDQLPRGLRRTLYVKDDDYRLSMTNGCYVTLTNLTDRDIERILYLHISPLYISVHATDPDVRRFLLGNKRAGEILDLMRLFAAHGIRMNTQVVMCNGINDGEVLSRTIDDLAALRPQVESVSVIPVGLTEHRRNLYGLKEVDRECARRAIALTEAKNALYGGDYGFCWCSDEMYVIAGLPVPDIRYYGDLPQIENGVGLIAEFLSDAEAALDALEDGTSVDEEFVLITGVAFYPTLVDVARRIETKCGAVLRVVRIENDFFGRSVTVAGLLTGGDIVAQLGDSARGKKVVIPDKTLKEFSDKFLDDMTLAELGERLQATIYVCHDAGDLVDIIVNKDGRR